MPELPEVEVIARKLRAALAGRTLTHADVLWERTIDRPAPDEFCRAVVGATVTEVDRRGKFLVLSFDTGARLLVHLRMSGKFAVRTEDEGPGDDPHTRVRFRLNDGTWVIYIDPRKFGRFYLVDDAQEVLGTLGPEPLSADFTADELAGRLAGRRGEIKRLLLDQRFIAGLGNIYVSEALWEAGIHPQRVAGSLTEAEAHRLYAAIVSALRKAVDHGGTSLEDRRYVYPDGGLGEHREHLNVYDRAGETCPRCGYAVERIVQGQRSSYFCPVCQRKGA